MRYIRTLVPLVMLGLLGSVLGCSGESNSTPEERKAFGKAMEADMKKAQREAMKARAAAKGGQGKGAH
jgi:hypothetical protein